MTDSRSPSMNRSEREASRLAALERYQVFDTPPEESFDRIARVAQSLFEAPIALVSLVGEHRQFFKACYGLDSRSTSKDVSFCAHVVDLERTLVVPDATQDARFANNGLVTGPPGIRFYAGAPLATRDGHILGSLCVIDTVPRARPEARLTTALEALARTVVDELEARRTHMLLREEEVARAHAQAELVHAHALLGAMLDATAGGLARTNLEGRVTIWNRRFVDIWGVSPHVLNDPSAGHLFEQLSRRVVAREGFDSAAREPAEQWGDVAEGVLELEDGRWLTWNARPQLLDDRVIGRVWSFLDVTRQKQAEIDANLARESLQYANATLEERVCRRTKRLEEANRQLQHDAFHDSLTNLPNRALLSDRLDVAISQRGRTPDTHFAVLFLDLDRFKIVNDSLGHSAGDELLHHVAKRLTHCVRDGDTVARLGGDEFVILLHRVTGPDAATGFAARIRDALAEPVTIRGQELHITPSIGIVTSDLDYASSEAILRDADIAMYQAKAKGPGHVVAFTPAMRERSAALLSLENDLRHAIERDHLTLHYQPIVDMRTGRGTGMEALLRWEHPIHGRVSPGEFIPVAEQTGLITRIDRWVLAEACRRLGNWSDPVDHPAWVSVNISGRQLLTADFADFVQSVLSEHDIQPHRLHLEITESDLVTAQEVVLGNLQSLRAIGVPVSIDDFGTGYSSLSYLQQLEVNTLKIDRAFIQHVSRSPESLELVKTIVAMANALHLSVVAEGIETIEQYETLKGLGCDYGQGYFFAHPDAPAPSLRRFAGLSPETLAVATSPTA